MKYIELGLTDYGVMIYGRVDDDGLMRVTCTADNPDYQAWLNPKDADQLQRLASFKGSG